MGKIIDFESHIKKRDRVKRRELDIGGLLAPFLEGGPLMQRMGRVVADQITRTVVAADIADTVAGQLRALGVDPSGCEPDEVSLRLFLTMPIPEGELEDGEPDFYWNGPYFRLKEADFEMLILTTAVMDEAEDVTYNLDILRREGVKKHWMVWDGEAWQRGPDDDMIETLTSYHAMRLSRMADSKGLEDFDGEDMPDPMFLLDLPDNVLDILDDNGFDTIDDIEAADDDELLAIPGIGKKTLKRIRDAVKEYLD